MGERLNIIYDDRHPENYDRLMGEFERQGITDYKLWSAIVYKESVVASINASHKMIVRDAKERKLKEVIIGEDDLWFPAENGWRYFLENKPDEFDIYAGCTMIPPVSNGMLCGFHLYIVAEKFYDKFLSVPDNQHIDTAVSDLKGDFKFCYPFPALQFPGYSANNQSVVNYNSIFKDEDVYGKFR